MVKNKTVNFLSILLLFITFALAAFLFYLINYSSVISPFSRQTLDLVPRLQEKISLQPDLDFSSSQTLTELEDIPRYLVYNDDTFQVYAAKNQDQSFAPASFTKLLTAQVALDLVSADQLLTASQHSVDRVPTVIGLKPGEQLTAEELIRASIATSANDAATTLAEGTARLFNLTLPDYLDLVNRKAQLLFMFDSRFATPDGLDEENQYSTLIDIAKLIHNAQQNYPEIISAGASDRDDLLANDLHGKYYLSNWNGLLGVYPGVTGLKIAYTGDAGYGTIVTAEIDDLSLVAIVSGADSIPERDLAAAALLDAALIAAGRSPVNLTKADLQPRYDQWQDLIDQTRRELEALDNQD